MILFLFSAGVILVNAEPFSESLVATGKVFGINEFLLVQWLAPIASEAPEFTVAILFTLRGHAGVALGSLLSAKLNQWTLLVGMIPGAYALSSGSLNPPIPMGSFQMNEILLTAAQSLLAVVLILGMRLDIKGAILLFALFIGQFISPGVVESLSGIVPWKANLEEVHHIFAILYLVAAACFIIRRRKAMVDLWKGFSNDEEVVTGVTPSIILNTSRRSPEQPKLEKALDAAAFRSS